MTRDQLVAREARILSSNAYLAQGLLAAAIREHAPAASRQALLEKVVEASFVPSAEALALPELAAHYLDICGADGMTDNAFSLEGRVVICPGKLFSAIGSGAHPTHARRNILRTMVHELGHLIDYRRHSQAYQPYYGCMSRHYATDLTHGPTVGPLFRPIDRFLKTAAHIDEIIADFWAVKTLVKYLKLVEAGLSGDEKVQVLAEAFSGSCNLSSGTEPDGEHPAPRFRVEAMLRADPEIQEMFGCAPRASGARPGCTLAGPTREPTY